MAIEDFGNRVAQVPGIKNYLLVRNDGKVIIHNIEKPESLASMVAFNGLNCEAISSMVGLTNLKYMMVTSKSNERLFIFPIDTSFLGIIQDPDAYSNDVVDNVIQLIQTVAKPK
jgi:predicted regulator of Ras-like GTPase activity (Roadblock/LC7/MglB family)